ncbi:early endosome antigen 1-like isoform X2, partial [Clarias magur]
ESLAEARSRYEQAMETITQLEEMNSTLKSKVSTLEKDLSQTRLMWKDQIRESLAEAQSRHEQAVEKITHLEEMNFILKSKVTTSQEDLSLTRIMWKDQIRETERQQEARASLEESLAEAQSRHEQAVEKMNHLEEMNSILKSKVTTLQEDLSLTQIMWKDQIRETERQQEARARLESQCKEMEETLKQRLTKKKLQISQAEAERKYNKAMESCAQLENEKTELLSQVNTLQGSVQQLEEELSVTHTTCAAVKESEQKQEVGHVLKAQSNPVNQTHYEKFLMESLAEAQRRHEQAVEKITHLEDMNSILKSKVAALQEDLSLTRIMWKDQIMETGRQQEARARLESQCKEMEETLKQQLMKKKLKASRAKAERKDNEAMESCAQLETEKTELLSQESEQKHEVDHFLKTQSNPVNQTHYEKFLMVLLSEAERKYDEAMLSCAQLQRENSELLSQVNTLRGSVQQDLEAELSVTHTKWTAVNVSE